MVVTLDTSLLLGYFASRTGQTFGGASSLGPSANRKYAPTAPWSPLAEATPTSELVKAAMLGKRLINEQAAKLDLDGASEDYRKLFSLYQGLNTLMGLAEKANGKNVAPLDMLRIKSVFAKGLAEVSTYADTAEFELMRLTRGTVGTSAKATVGVPKNKYDYVTDVLHTGAATDEIPAFQGPAAFDIQVKKLNVTTTVSLDLSEMGATPRTMSNVVNYINNKLKNAGVMSRFGVERTPGAERKIEGANGKTITLPALGDSYAMRIKGDLSEQLTFAAVTKPAVYVTTYAGDPDPDKDVKTDDGVFRNSLIKIDPSGATPPETRVKTETLEGNILGVRQTKIGPDGSVYMLADVEKSIAGQTVKGETDVALLKYDTAGNLLFARSLGAAKEAAGLGLAVDSATGKVAISGSVQGALTGATNGPINSSDASAKNDSFVTLFDAKGDEVWTVRRGAIEDDEAGPVAFGADGTVYVAGRTKSAMPAGGGAFGGYDGYLTAIATTDKGAAKVLFTQQFGTTADDKPAGLVVNGDQVIVASSENGSGVLRSFDVSLTEVRTTRTIAGGTLTQTTETYVGGVLQSSASQNWQVTAPDGQTVTSYTSAGTVTAGATRNIGVLAGGAIAGLALDGGELVIAGHTGNAALALGPASSAHAGAQDAFAARLSTDLTSTAQDELAYYGGAGSNTVSGFSVAGGKVWLAGSAGADLPGLTTEGTKQGYVAALDTATGAVSGAQRISGKDGHATATSIAVDASGGSVLDRFGLPKGTLNYEASQKIVSATSARAGDTFQIRTRPGAPPVTITLDANDTLQTLATTIRRKAGFNAKVEVVSSGDSRVLKISPATDNAVVEILPGKGGKDLLEAIGLEEGVVRRTEFIDGKQVATAPGGEVYGLALDSEINLDDKTQIAHAMAVLGAALGKIRTAYRDLENLAKPASLLAQQRAASGPVPAYLQAQIANYQAGLARLTGGG